MHIKINLLTCHAKAGTVLIRPNAGFFRWINLVRVFPPINNGHCWCNSLRIFHFTYLPGNYLFFIVAQPGFGFADLVRDIMHHAESSAFKYGHSYKRSYHSLTERRAGKEINH